jgi:NNP family nitrate/nitrite transporter-like MFS transporter
MSMGTCFGIVSYVDGPNTGTVAGIVGAGGNVGAVWLGRIFMNNANYQDSMEYMGWFTVVLAFLTPLIVIKGYRGLLFGKEEEHLVHDVSFSPLMVPS